MQARVLHTLSQRPSLTGSGIPLAALVREAAVAGWRQRALIGVPAGVSSARCPSHPMEPIEFRMCNYFYMPSIACHYEDEG